MPRSSDSIGALAAALAKAQGELTNPEKTLTATLPAAGPGVGEPRSFRYASLASGLEIVRQCLGRHEIAVMQTTTLDEACVRLTTMLVHASGEWVSSDWPVCPISELASPQRMGAALTYARRYGLFALAGIAGEDDLDAPDLNSGAAAAFPRPANGQNGHGRGNGFVSPDKARDASSSFVNGGKGAKRAATPRPPLLPEARSVQERNRLLGELQALSGAEALATWAHTILPIKNTLSIEHARCVEAAFARRLAAGVPAEPPGEAGAQADAEADAGINGAPVPATPRGRADLNTTNLSTPAPGQGFAPACLAASPPVRRRHARRLPKPPLIDKSVLALSEPRRLRDREHLKFVARQPCLICGRSPSDPHHLRFAQPRALGCKVSDEFTVPLCRTHHRQLHHVGDERSWWSGNRLDPLPVAEALWRRTHPIGRTAGDDAPLAPSGPA